MSKDAMDEIRECIAFYDSEGRDWTDAVTYTGIKHCFGSWMELQRGLSGRRDAGGRTHNFVERDGVPFPFCSICGVVKRKDGKNGHCKGPTKMRPTESPALP
jgi:hypothetical protein